MFPVIDVKPQTSCSRQILEMSKNQVEEYDGGVFSVLSTLWFVSSIILQTSCTAQQAEPKPGGCPGNTGDSQLLLLLL